MRAIPGQVPGRGARLRGATEVRSHAIVDPTI